MLILAAAEPTVVGRRELKIDGRRESQKQFGNSAEQEITLPTPNPSPSGAGSSLASLSTTPSPSFQRRGEIPSRLGSNHSLPIGEGYGGASIARDGAGGGSSSSLRRGG